MIDFNLVTTALDFYLKSLGFPIPTIAVQLGYLENNIGGGPENLQAIGEVFSEKSQAISIAFLMGLNAGIMLCARVHGVKGVEDARKENDKIRRRGGLRAVPKHPV